MYFPRLTCSLSVGLFLLSSHLTNKRIYAEQCDSQCHVPIYDQNKNIKLKYVSILFRHGYRTPIFKKMPSFVEEIDWPESLLETDENTVIPYRTVFASGSEYREKSKFDQEKLLQGGATTGMLTKAGQGLMFLKGQLLKKRYLDDTSFINNGLSNANIRIHSTNFQRTIESARCVLAGLLSGTALTETWKFNVFHTGSDTTFPNLYFCKPLNTWNQQAIANARTLEHSKSLYEDLASELKMSANEIPSSVDLWDIVQSRESCSMALPDILQRFRGKIHDSAVETQVYITMGNTLEIKKLLWGNLVYRLLDDLTRATTDEQIKMSFISAHDSSLMVILESLGLFDHQWPELGSMLCIELYQNTAETDPTNQWLLRFIYNEKVLSFPNGDQMISLNKLRTQMSKFMINKDEWLNQCQIKPFPIEF